MSESERGPIFAFRPEPSASPEDDNLWAADDTRPDLPGTLPAEPSSAPAEPAEMPPDGDAWPERAPSDATSLPSHPQGELVEAASVAAGADLPEGVPAIDILPPVAGIPQGPSFPPAPVAHPIPSAPRLDVWKDEFVAWVKTLASAAVYATLIVTFLFQVARVEGQSMAPTLADQDRLIVNKLQYRLDDPQRDDIVMLYYPVNPDKSFVKRVIGQEGDTVRVVDGRVYVNDVPVADNQVPPEYRSHDDWGPQVIPEGYYFVLGDHRNNSLDSRHWGFVPKKYIIGKVQLRWWPVPNATIF